MPTAKSKIQIEIQALTAAAKKNITTFANSFKGLRTQILSTEKGIAPLTRQVAGLAASFASVAAVGKAIKLARFQIEQQVKLQVALGENIHLFDEMLESAARFQRATLFTDEVTLSVTALALSFGVAVDEIDDFIAAAAAVATIGIVPSFEAAARQLLFFRSGRGQPLSALARLPLAKNLTEAERAAGGVEKAINRLLGDVAREVAKTPFGVLQQDINLIADEFERLGRVLILIVGPAINQAKLAFSGFVDSVDRAISPAVPLINAAIQPIAGILRELIKLTAVIALFKILAKTFKLVGLQGFLGKLIKIIRILANPFGLVLGFVIAIVVGLGVLAAKVKPIREAFGGLFVLVAAVFSALKQLLVEAAEPFAALVEQIVLSVTNWVDKQIEAGTALGKFLKRLIEINDGIKDGSITFEEVVQDARLALVRAFVFIKSKVINPFSFGLRGVINAFKNGFLVAWKAIRVAGTAVLIALAVVFERIITGVTIAIDGVTKGIGKAISLFDEEAGKKFGTGLAKSEFVLLIQELPNALADQLREQVDELGASIDQGAAEQEKLNREFEESQGRLQDILDKELQRDAIARKRFARERSFRESPEGITAESKRIQLLREARIDAERLGNAQILAATEGRVREEFNIENIKNKRLLAIAKRLGIDKLELSEDEALAIRKKQINITKALGKAELTELQTSLKKREINFEQFARRRKQLAVETIDFELRLLEQEQEGRIVAIEAEEKKRIEFAARQIVRAQKEQAALDAAFKKQKKLLDDIENKRANISEEAAESQKQLVARELEERLAALGKIRIETAKQAEEELITINSIARFQEEAAKLAGEITLKLLERRTSLAQALKQIEQKRLEALREEVKVTRFLNELRERGLISARKDFEASLLQANQSIIESINQVRETLKRFPTELEIKIFIAESDLAREAAVTDELARITEKLTEKTEEYNASIARRNRQVLLGTLQSQSAIDLNERDLKVIIRQTKATIDQVAALALQVITSEEFAGKQRLLKEVTQELTTVQETLNAQLAEQQLLLLELTGTFDQGLVSGLRNFITQQENAFAKGIELAQALTEEISTNLTDAFVDIIKGTKTAKEAFLDFARDTVEAILRVIIQMIILKALSLALGGVLPGGAIPGGNKGGLIERSKGGPIPKRNEGGFVGRKVSISGYSKGGSVDDTTIKPKRKKDKFADKAIEVSISGRNEGGSVDDTTIKRRRKKDKSADKAIEVSILGRNEGGSVDDTVITRRRKKDKFADKAIEVSISGRNEGGSVSERDRDGKVTGTPIRIRDKHKLIGRSAGGPIPGRGPDRDTVIIGATPGEFVLRRASSDYYGRAILNALNSRSIPRNILTSFGKEGGREINDTGGFQRGGEVTPERPRQAGTSVLPVLVADSEAMDNLLKGGKNELLDFLRENRDQFLGEDIARTS